MAWDIILTSFAVMAAIMVAAQALFILVSRLAARREERR